VRQIIFILALTIHLSAFSAAPQLSVTRVASGLNAPVFVCAPPGDTSRLFILEQHTGNVLILNLGNGTLNATPFLTISNVLQTSEQGLLGMAFDPNYATNGYFYLDYSMAGGGAAGHDEIARFTVQGSPATSNLADPTSKQVILTIDKPESNHNGGWIGFGPDGFLYISAGDGGGANDAHGTIGNAQDRSVLLGKMLRIDVSSLPYKIPPTNPFVGDATKKPEIWAFGLRNPWRCSFDRATGNLWIGDVGQDTREEIDFDPAGSGGLNFGWRPREGFIQNSVYPTETPVTTETKPVTDYDHNIGVNAIIGGYVYQGSAIAGLQGTYIHGDYGSARFWSFNYDGTNLTNVQEITAQLNAGKIISDVSSFGEDAAGELYICSYSVGEIYRITGPSAGGGGTGAGGTGGAGANPITMTVSKLSAKMKFSSGGHDSASIAGIIPNPGAGFDPTGQVLTLDIGGAVVNFTLDAKGHGKSGNGTFALTLKGKTKKTAFPGGNVPFKANLKNGDWANLWSTAGFDPSASVTNQPITMVVNIHLLGQLYTATVSAKYSGTSGKTGGFKM
jgi:glucose/arabinose dehydrogenase